MKYFYLIILFLPTLLNAQLEGKLLSNVFDDVTDAVIGDINGDAKMDIFFTYDGLRWYEQDNISQNDWISHKISDAGSGDLALIDVDQDDDLDFVFTKYGKVEYYENLNALGTETALHQVFNFDNLGNYRKVFFVDIDGDDDLDLVSDGIAWAENKNGYFDFDEEVLIYAIPDTHGIGFDINFVDWDFDGDLDIVVILEVADDVCQIKLIRNNDQSEFDAPEIILDSFPSWNRSNIRIADVDKDDDLDIVMHRGPNDIVWYRNANGVLLADEKFIHEYFDAPGIMEVVDIDNDNLLDIIWCGHGGVFWKSNNGGFTFDMEAMRIGPNEDNKATNKVIFGDLDGDGDQDMLRLGRAISNFPQRFAWYENHYPKVTTSVDDFESHFDVFPNPFSDVLHVIGEYKTLELFDMNGRLQQANFESGMDINWLSEGSYLLRINLDNGRHIHKKIIKLE